MKVRAMLAGAVLYALAAVSANGQAVFEGLLTGDMQKLIPTDPPRAVAEVAIEDLQGGPASLADFRGRWVVLNFWATWCAPCREEMPTLDRLQAARPEIAVVPVATGPNPLPGLTRFWEEAGIVNLVTLCDPSRALAAEFGVMGLPVTVILNPEGAEVARLIGEAIWDGPAALAVIDALRAAH